MAAAGGGRSDKGDEAAPAKAPTAVVCDDDAMLRRVVATVLTDCGYEVVAQTEFAWDTIDMAKELGPDVILLDLSLVGMSGVEAIPQIKEAAPDTHVVVFSAFDSMLADAERHGATAAVNKSDLEGLEEVLRRLAEPPPAG
jgi:CheY-like chemotaxis protein